MFGFLRRNSNEFQQQQTKIILFNTLVRSHLEFASVVWSPFYNVHSQRVESIQRAFTRYIAFRTPGFSHRNPYESRLSKFNMDSLRDRRRMFDICFLRKIVNGQLNCSDLLGKISISVPRNYPRRPISKILSIPTTRTNLGLQSPLVRICSSLNHFTCHNNFLDVFHDSLTRIKSEVLPSQK